MALNPQDLPSDRQAQRLADLYRQAQQDIAREIERAVLLGDDWKAQERRRQLRAVVDAMAALGRETDPEARAVVAQAFSDGAALAAADVVRLGATTSPGMERAFNAVNREAVKAAEDALLGRLQSARRGVVTAANDVFRQRTRETALRALLGAEGSPQKASRALRRRLVADGQVAFTDRAGRRWKLADYADMAIRTETRHAVVEGQVNRLAAHGIDLVRVSRHATACPVCQPHEGKLIDLAGDTTVFLGEPVADGPLPPYHPRCRHTIGGVSRRAEEIRAELLEAS